MTTMRTIWKFPLFVEDEQIVRMPKGAEILHAAFQLGVLCLWAKVDPDADEEERYVRIAGTGHPISESGGMRHIATVLTADGSLVWHVFETV